MANGSLGQAVGVALNLGYPGTPSQSSDKVTVNRIASGEIPFGAAVAINPDNTVSVFGATNTEDQFLGIAERIVKQQSDVFESGGVYNDKDPVDIMVRGNVIVAFNGMGVPAAGNRAFIRIADNTAYPDANIGDIEAEADGTNTLELTNVRVTTGRLDSTGVVEITITERRI